MGAFFEALTPRHSLQRKLVSVHCGCSVSSRGRDLCLSQEVENTCFLSRRSPSRLLARWCGEIGLSKDPCQRARITCTYAFETELSSLRSEDCSLSVLLAIGKK